MLLGSGGDDDGDFQMDLWKYAGYNMYTGHFRLPLRSLAKNRTKCEWSGKRGPRF